MAGNPPLRDLLGRTRGEMLTLLCSSPRTVGELAESLGLTRNAVRGHLARLERDGMVRHTVTRQGVGKPAHLYEATPGGRGLMSRAYQPVLGAVLDVLAEAMRAEELDGALRQAGHRLGVRHARPAADRPTRVRAALEVLEELGAVVELEEQGGDAAIRGRCCPLADLVARHPGICAMVEAMLSDIVGLPVREQCDRGALPGCRFRIVGGGGGRRPAAESLDAPGV